MSRGDVSPEVTTERQIAHRLIDAPAERAGIAWLEAVEVSAPGSAFVLPSYYVKAVGLDGKPTAFRWCDTEQDVRAWWMSATGGEELPKDAFREKGLEA